MLFDSNCEGKLLHTRAPNGGGVGGQDAHHVDSGHHGRWPLAGARAAAFADGRSSGGAPEGVLRDELLADVVQETLLPLLDSLQVDSSSVIFLLCSPQELAINGILRAAILTALPRSGGPSSCRTG